jgi:transposase
MQAIFKSHSVHQQTLFALDLNVLIAEDHSARLIDSVVEKLEIPDIISQYKGGGTSGYHPKMLIKILFIDGTKIEANAHKYSFVWKKSVEKNKANFRIR